MHNKTFFTEKLHIACSFKTGTCFLIALLVLFCWDVTASRAGKEGFLMREYPTSVVLPQGRWEISLDYTAMNDQIDIFDVKSTQVSGTREGFGSLGDMKGGRIIANYGLFESTTIHTKYLLRDLDYGFGNMNIHNYQVSIRQNILGEKYSSWPFLSVALGIKGNRAEDKKFSSDSNINRFVHQIYQTGFSLRDEKNKLWFDKKTESGEISVGIPKNGGPDPNVTLEDSHDCSWFGRITAGKVIGNFYPNLFFEYGHTSVDGEVGSSLTYYQDKVSKYIGKQLPDLPIDLSRDEHYFKIGSVLICNLPWDIMATGEYYYMDINREGSLNQVSNNHVFKGNLSYFINDYLALNLGGKYFHHQYSGIIPFLYNRYTQGSFDKRYGEAYLGFTFILGGRN